MVTSSSRWQRPGQVFEEPEYVQPGIKGG
ncbi:hypothetical protein pipiens_009745 [Culex pipiens pipiens]|uniref:Uncharacterized protein n=1 Tax=Culex pipiens pipiens TaxID=38569 RepID=A0ABD1DEI8_CULPP